MNGMTDDWAFWFWYGVGSWMRETFGLVGTPLVVLAVLGLVWLYGRSRGHGGNGFHL